MLKPNNFLIFIFFLVASQLAYTLVFYIPGIYADQWDLVPKIELLFSGKPWLSSILQRHVDHLHFTSQLSMMLMASLSQWNPLWEVTLTHIVNIAAFVVLYIYVLNPMLQKTSAVNGLLCVTIVLLYFSFAHAGNLLWTWQLSVQYSILGALASLAALTRKNTSIKLFLIATLGALFSTFSFSCGLALWPVGFLLILTSNNLSISKRLIFLCIWTLLTLILAWVFWEAYDGNVSQRITFSLAEILIFLGYALGTPLAYFSRDLSLVLASISVVIFICLAINLYKKRKDHSLYRIALAFALFAVGSIILIALGRLDLGVSQARSFRYIIFSQFFWFALFILIWIYCSVNNILESRFILGSILLMIILILFNGQKIGRASVEVSLHHRELLTQFYALPVAQRDQVWQQLDYPKEPQLTQYIGVLKQYRLNIYADSQVGQFGQKVTNLFREAEKPVETQK